MASQTDNTFFTCPIFLIFSSSFAYLFSAIYVDASSEKIVVSSTTFSFWFLCSIPCWDNPPPPLPLSSLFVLARCSFIFFVLLFSFFFLLFSVFLSFSSNLCSRFKPSYASSKTFSSIPPSWSSFETVHHSRSLRFATITKKSTCPCSKQTSTYVLCSLLLFYCALLLWPAFSLFLSCSFPFLPVFSHFFSHHRISLLFSPLVFLFFVLCFLVFLLPRVDGPLGNAKDKLRRQWWCCLLCFLPFPLCSLLSSIFTSVFTFFCLSAPSLPFSLLVFPRLPPASGGWPWEMRRDREKDNLTAASAAAACPSSPPSGPPSFSSSSSSSSSSALPSPPPPPPEIIGPGQVSETSILF